MVSLCMISHAVCVSSHYTMHNSKKYFGKSGFSYDWKNSCSCSCNSFVLLKKRSVKLLVKLQTAVQRKDTTFEVIMNT